MFGGEPLEHLDVLMHIAKSVNEVCIRNKKFFSTSLTTNGYYLNCDTLNSLRNKTIKNNMKDGKVWPEKDMNKFLIDMDDIKEKDRKFCEKFLKLLR